MNTQLANASILLVNVEQFDDAGRCDGFMSADSGRGAIELLHMLDFDLLVVGTPLPDIDLGEFVRTVKQLSRWQKWAMVSPQLSADEEIEARSLGAACVFDQTPDVGTLSELAGKIRKRPAAAKAAPQSRPAQLVVSESQ